MNQAALVKAYGGFKPASTQLRARLLEALKNAVPAENAVVSLCGDLCSFSFEGIFFPLEDAACAVEETAAPETRGRLDYLDIEGWRLKRLELSDGKFSARETGLNNVLDYSGF